MNRNLDLHNFWKEKMEDNINYCIAHECLETFEMVTNELMNVLRIPKNVGQRIERAVCTCSLGTTQRVSLAELEMYSIYEGPTDVFLINNIQNQNREYDCELASNETVEFITKAITEMRLHNESATRYICILKMALSKEYLYLMENAAESECDFMENNARDALETDSDSETNINYDDEYDWNDLSEDDRMYDYLDLGTSVCVTAAGKADLHFSPEVSEIEINTELDIASPSNGSKKVEYIPGNLNNGSKKVEYIPGNLNNGSKKVEYIPGNLNNGSKKVVDVAGNPIDGSKNVKYIVKDEIHGELDVPFNNVTDLNMFDMHEQIESEKSRGPLPIGLKQIKVHFLNGLGSRSSEEDYNYYPRWVEKVKRRARNKYQLVLPFYRRKIFDLWEFSLVIQRCGRKFKPCFIQFTDFDLNTLLGLTDNEMLVHIWCHAKYINSVVWELTRGAKEVQPWIDFSYSERKYKRRYLGNHIAGPFKANRSISSELFRPYATLSDLALTKELSRDDYDKKAFRDNKYKRGPQKKFMARCYHCGAEAEKIPPEEETAANVDPSSNFTSCQHHPGYIQTDLTWSCCERESNKKTSLSITEQHTQNGCSWGPHMWRYIFKKREKSFNNRLHEREKNRLRRYCTK